MKYILSVLGFFLINVANSQSSYINNRLNFQLGLSSRIEYYQPLISEFETKTISAHSAFGYARFFETGINAGKSWFVFLGERNTSYLFFGLEQRMQLLPVFTNKPNCRFDLYIPASFNISKMKYTHSLRKGVLGSYYSFGLGGSIHFLKSFGIFSEATLNNRVNNKLKPNFEFGISYFRKKKNA